MRRRIPHRRARTARSRLRALLAALGVPALLLLAAGGTGEAATASATGAAAAQSRERTITILDFHADLRVDERARLHVTESITLRFDGAWNGIYRMIPVEYRTPQGLSYRLRPDFQAVTDGAGEPLRFEVGRDRHYREVQIWIPGAVDATRTIHIAYSIPNALRFFEEHDELYWNVTGDEWPYAIEHASALVQLPEDTDGLRANAFTGGFGATERGAVIEAQEGGFYIETLRPLGMREGLTIGVAWNPGVVRPPGPFTRARWFLLANWFFFFPFVSLGVMHRLWRARGRDPERRPVAPRYEPPEGMRPAEAGTLVDHRLDPRDITSTVVDLAVRGHLRIEEKTEKKFLGLSSETTYRFVRLEADDADLHAHEQAMLDALFDDGRRDSVLLSDIENEFYRELKKIRDGVHDRLLAMGLYHHRPDRTLQAYMGFGTLVLVLGVAGGIAVSQALFLSTGGAIAAAVLTALPVFGFGIFMPARTLKGARALEEVLGFEEFLDRVESDRFRRMITSPEMFERYLPWAMAFGVEKKWAKAFEDLYREPPSWYRGTDPSGFRTGLFVGRLSAMSTRTAAAMSSQPRSSGGSSFGGGGGGGGFSGGGFGGGGGRGF